MDPVCGGVLLQFVAAIVGTILWLVKRTKSSKAAVVTSGTAMAWAAAAGLAVGAAELLSFFISGMGVQAMQSIPIVVGGSVLMGTVLGRVWLKEMLTWRGWCGVALISIGIALVGLDPGSSGTMHWKGALSKLIIVYYYKPAFRWLFCTAKTVTVLW